MGFVRLKVILFVGIAFNVEAQLLACNKKIILMKILYV